MEWDKGFAKYRYLASIETIHNNNLYTDIIFFWCQFKQILFLTVIALDRFPRFSNTGGSKYMIFINICW